jgi:hypothetical protein
MEMDTASKALAVINARRQRFIVELLCMRINGGRGGQRIFSALASEDFSHVWYS